MIPPDTTTTTVSFVITVKKSLSTPTIMRNEFMKKWTLKLRTKSHVLLLLPHHESHVKERNKVQRHRPTDRGTDKASYRERNALAEENERIRKEKAEEMRLRSQKGG